MKIPPLLTDPADCDVYKWSMSNFLFKKGYLKDIVGWRYINRSGTKFPLGYAAELRKQVDSWQDLSFSENTLNYFTKALYWLDYNYVWSYLKSYEFDTSCIKIEKTEQGGFEDIAISYEGEWGQVIFFEIYLLSTMSELYTRMGGLDKYTLNPTEQRLRNSVKIARISDCGAKVSEFGTRRRYSKEQQELVINQILEETPGMLTGTSNAMFAQKYDLIPIGTMGHELVMYMGAKYGPSMADTMLMREWVEVYQGALGIYLTDTYTTKHFLSVFDLLNSKLWDGVREDSAPDTDRFVDNIIEHYNKMRIDPATKSIVHSNGINDISKIIHMQKYRNKEIHRSFGLGTWLTHDVYREDTGFKAYDWVIKMTHIYQNNRKKYCVKISDIPEKATSQDAETMRRYLADLGVV